MVNHDIETLGKAIEYAADEILVRDDEITVQELVQSYLNVLYDSIARLQ